MPPLPESQFSSVVQMDDTAAVNAAAVGFAIAEKYCQNITNGESPTYCSHSSFVERTKSRPELPRGPSIQTIQFSADIIIVAPIFITAKQLTATVNTFSAQLADINIHVLQTAVADLYCSQQVNY